MQRHSQDSLVIGYESLIATLAFCDPDDRHVLAAGIVGRADVIITHNARFSAGGALAA